MATPQFRYINGIYAWDVAGDGSLGFVDVTYLLNAGGGGAMTVADGADVAQGALADTAVTNPASNASEIALLKGLVTLLAAATPAGTNLIGKVNLDAAVMPASTTLQNAAGTGNPNGTSLNVQGYSTAIIQVVSSTPMSGGTTINFEASADDTTWVSIAGHQVGLVGAFAVTATADGNFRFNVAGFKSLRTRFSTWSAGVTTIKGYVTPIPSHPTSVVPSGNVAAGAADTGNPQKVGGKYNATLPTLTDGQRGDLQVDSRSQEMVNLGVRLDETNDAIRAVTEGYKASYSASATALAPAATATDIFEIKGSATKTVRITRIQITGVATAAGTYDVQVVKRSTANTGGTSTAPTAVPHDSADAAATAALKAYTANPTLGTAVGTMRAQKATVGTAATSAVPCVPVVLEFGKDNVRACVLRGIAESLCVNLNGVTITGGLLDVDCSWTEEA